MKLHSIKAFGFRSYHFLAENWHPRVNILVGKNGVGKTNLLDMIHYLATGKSYFTGLDRNVVQLTQDVIRVEGQVSSQEQDDHVVVKWLKGGGKELIWNEAHVQRISEHIGRIPVVMMAPQDAFVMQLANAERLKWYDRLLCQKHPEYARSLQRYHRVLKRKNAYLKQTAIHKIDDGLLKIYWEQMGPEAEIVHRIRRQSAPLIAKTLSTHYAGISNDAESVDFKYRSALDSKSWKDILKLRADIENRGTQAGVHKDRIDFLLKDGPLKLMGSQGQTKSYFMALKWAEAVFLRREGEWPILLIDDVYSHLDESRLNLFFQKLSECENMQIFVTDTHPDRMQKLMEHSKMAGTIYQVTPGSIKLRDGEEE